jgi:transcriptional regulator
MGTKKPAREVLLPGTLDMLILKSLTRGVMHGYGIAEHIQQLSEDVLKVEEGTLYPALQRLQVQKLIASEWGHSLNNRRARYYRLTPAGRRQLEASESSFSRVLAAIARVMKPARA